MSTSIVPGHVLDRACKAFSDGPPRGFRHAMRAALEAAMTTSGQHLGEGSQKTDEVSHGGILGASQSNPVMEAAWKTYNEIFDPPREDQETLSTIRSKAFEAAVRAGVAVATKELQDDLAEQTRIANMRAGYIAEYIAERADLQKTVESLRVENASIKQDYKLAESHLQEMATQAQDLRAQLAALDWQPVSNPPKEEDWWPAKDWSDGGLLMILDEAGHLGTNSKSQGIKNATYWCRPPDRPALPKAEEKRNPHLDFTRPNNPDQEWSEDVVKIWNAPLPQETIYPPKKRIPWTMADAVEHGDCWFKLKETTALLKITGILEDGIYLTASYFPWGELMERGEYSYDPLELLAASWHGCWKEEA